jgi:mannose-6-phosphate isomerase-like protein (cupin superfamily)
MTAVRTTDDANPDGVPAAAGDAAAAGATHDSSGRRVVIRPREFGRGAPTEAGREGVRDLKVIYPETGFDAATPCFGIVEIDPGRHSPLHRHRCEEMYYVLRGADDVGRRHRAPRPGPPQPLRLRRLLVADRRRRQSHEHHRSRGTALRRRDPPPPRRLTWTKGRPVTTTAPATPAGGTRRVPSHFIAGQWVTPRRPAPIDVHDSNTGAVLGGAPDGTVDEAVDIANDTICGLHSAVYAGPPRRHSTSLPGWSPAR